MIVCAACGKRRKTYNSCSQCSNVFCRACSLEAESGKCVQCGHPTETVRVFSAEIPDLDLDWVEIGDRSIPKIGVAELDRIPRNIPLSSLSEASDAFEEVIVCPDAASVGHVSIQYANHVGAPWPTKKEEEFLPHSRYRTFPLSHESTDNIVLFNAEALDLRDVKFLLSYLSEYHKEARKAMSSKSIELSRAVLDTIFNYQKRLGFTFMNLEDSRVESLGRLQAVMARSWAEYETLTKMVLRADPSAIAGFVSYRLDILEGTLTTIIKDLVSMDFIIEAFLQYLQASAVCVAVSTETGLYKTAMQRFKQVHVRLLKEAESHDSLQSMLDTARIELTDPKTFECQSMFEERVPEVLRTSFSKLGTEFFDISGALGLVKMTVSMMEQVEVAPWTVPEPLINNLLETCESISKKEDVHPFISWVASRMKLQVLISLGYFILDPIICKKVERTAKGNLLRFEGQAESLKVPYLETKLDDGELLLDVLSACGLCLFLGDYEAAGRLRELLESRRHLPDAKTALAQVLWAEFLAYEDYDRLAEFRSILPEIRSDREPLNELLEPMFDLLELIADAIIREDKRFERFAEAQLMAAEGDFFLGPSIKDMAQYYTMSSILEVLPSLYQAANSKSIRLLVSHLHRAIEGCEYFTSLEREESPNYLMYLKTLLLEKMALGDVDESTRILKEVMNHQFSSPTTKQLGTIVATWADTKTGDADTVLSTLDMDTPSQSPWILIARRLATRDAKAAYLEVIRDSKEPSREASLQGAANYWKGRSLELALHICYLKEGYEVEPRLMLSGSEYVDLLCYRTEKGLCEALLVDVKFTREKYGYENASSFALRLRKLVENLEKVVPLSGTERVRVGAVVASSSGVSKRARALLSDELGEVPLRVLTGVELSEFLMKFGVKLPSLPSEK